MKELKGKFEEKKEKLEEKLGEGERGKGEIK